MAIRLGRWDCPVCGQIGNLGNATSCPSCGSPRGKDVEFYLPKDSDAITDEKLLQEAKAGVDWICDYCGSDNKATATTCKSCGNERTKDDTDRTIKEFGLEDTPDSDPVKRARQIQRQQLQEETPKNSSRGKKLLFLAMLFILGLIILLIPRSFKVEVVKHSWFRAIEIENNRLVTEEDWSTPANAVSVLNSYRAIHHYDKVLSHYETRTRTVREQVGSESYICGRIDRGNGYFEDKYCDRPVYESRQESYEAPVYTNVPVYGTKYKYTIYRWLKDHDIKAQGEDKNPKWPVENFVNSNWREGAKTEKYILYVKDKKGKEYKEELDYNLWSSINIGQEVYAKRNSMGSFYGIDKNKLLKYSK
ncbi:MAG: Ran-binding zinc finger domain-containing protein [Candidatus Sericytochromatia bacterium]